MSEFAAERVPRPYDLAEIVDAGCPAYCPAYGGAEVVHRAPLVEEGVSHAPRDGRLANNLPLSIKEGMYIEKGQNLFNVVNPHMLWAIIKIEPKDIGALKLNQPVIITLPDLPEKTFCVAACRGA